MNITAFSGIVFGIITGLVICVILFRYANKDKKIKTSYDERQEAIRNRGYKYAFYTVLAYETVLLCFGMARGHLPIPSYALNFLGIILGCTVLGVYCVLKDAFWGMNNDHRRYFIIFAVTGVLNLIPVLGSYITGTLISDGEFTAPIINLMVMIMLLALMIALAVKKVMLKESDN